MYLKNSYLKVVIKQNNKKVKPRADNYQIIL